MQLSLAKLPTAQVFAWPCYTDQPKTVRSIDESSHNSEL